jgi:hypothetical protein
LLRDVIDRTCFKGCLPPYFLNNVIYKKILNSNVLGFGHMIETDVFHKVESFYKFLLQNQKYFLQGQKSHFSQEQKTLKALGNIGG